MIVITRTPVRISFLGGGTDYADFFIQHGGGEVLVTAIDKFSYIKVSSLLDFFDYKIRVTYRKTELVQTPDEIEHPSVRECLRFMKTPSPLEIHYMGDLPARTGLGSSSSFTVGILNALHAYVGEAVSPMQLAREACEVEHNWIGERVGYQDQCIAAFGGFRYIRFLTSTEFEVTPVPISTERLKDFRRHLLIFYTGISRLAHEILEEQVERTKQNQNEAALKEMRQLVNEGVSILAGRSLITDFGKLLHQSWRLKQSLSSVITTQKISWAYESALQAGAIGGKLLGAGGGGFLLLFAPPDRHNAIRAALHPLPELDFSFEHSGTQIIFYNP